jgi:hypothetical protein
MRGADSQGYGMVRIDGNRKMYKIHRLVAEKVYGVIPKGKVIMHTCDNPSCVNPSHLRVGTYKENTQDMWSKGRHRRAGNTHTGYAHGNTKLSYEVGDKVRELHDRGWSDTEIAEAFGISRASAYNMWALHKWEWQRERAAAMRTLEEHDHVPNKEEI